MSQGVRAAYNVQRRLLIQARQQNNYGLTAAQVNTVLDINRTTSERWWNEFQSTGQTRAQNTTGRRQIVDTEMLDILEMIVTEDKVRTVHELNTLLRQCDPQKPQVTDECIRYHVHKSLGLTFKKAVKQKYDVNVPRFLDMREEYATWFFCEGQDKTLVFIDETGLNMWLTRSHGWSIIGAPCVTEVDTQRGKRVTLIAAIAPGHGLIHHDVIRGGLTADLFQDFLSELSSILGPETEAVFVFDNCRSHLNMSTTYASHTIRFLPPYSPYLNPIELTFSVFKSHVKMHLSNIHVPIVNRAAATARNMTLANYGYTVLEEAVEYAVEKTYSTAYVDSCHRHTYSFLNRCLEGEPIHA